jgi:hypothetical protein
LYENDNNSLILWKVPVLPSLEKPGLDFQVSETVFAGTLKENRPII